MSTENVDFKQLRATNLTNETVIETIEAVLNIYKNHTKLHGHDLVLKSAILKLCRYTRTNMESEFSETEHLKTFRANLYDSLLIECKVSQINQERESKEE